MAKYSPEETYDVSENEIYNQGKLPFKKWVENIWYHYKWTIVLVGAIAIFLIVALVQLFKNKEPDVNIMHVGHMMISPADLDDINATVGAMAYDCNGDDEVNVNVLDITINKFVVETTSEDSNISNSSADMSADTTEETSSETNVSNESELSESSDESSKDWVNFDGNNQGYTRFQTEIRAGDAIIYFLDEPYFNECVEIGLLVPFEDIIDDAYMPENVISGCGVKISDLDAYDLPGLSSFPETAILCLRRSPGEDEIAYGRTQEEWECNKTAFVNIIKHRS